MNLHRFEDVQRLPITHERAWDFFADPANLAKITPPWLGFEAEGLPAGEMYPGLILTHRVRPLLGVPVTWVTEITHVAEPTLFVDEQRFGPYRFWHHQHHFRPFRGGTEMRDIVHYALPLGGGMVRRWLVTPKIEAIFAYRRQVLEDTFGTF